MQGFIILGSALVATLLFTLLPGLRYLRQALTANTGRALLPVLVFVVTMLGSSQGADLTSSIPDPLRLVRMIMIITLFLAALFSILQQLGLAFARAGGGARWMMAYAVFAMCSAVWSVGPALSLWKGFEVLTHVMVAVTIAVRLRTLDDVQWLHRLMTLVLLFLCMTVLTGLAFYPADAIKDPITAYTTNESYFAVRGIVPILNPASVGALGALLSVLTVASLLHADSATRASRSGVWALLGVGVLIMLMAHTRTSIFAATAAILMQLVYARRWRLLAVTAVAGVVLLAATSLDEIVLKYIYRGQTAEAFMTLTGRLGAWEIFWDKFMTSPFVGYGYYAAQRLIFGTASVDNSYLEVLLGLGFLGFGIFLAPTVWATFRLYANRPRGGQVTFQNYLWLSTAGIFVVLLLRSLTGQSFQVMHPLLVVYLIVQISTAAMVRMRASSVSQSSDQAPQQKPAPGMQSQRRSSRIYAHGGTRTPTSRYLRFDKK